MKQFIIIGAVLATLFLSACASLPTSAPTLSQVRRSAIAPAANELPYTLVTIDVDTARDTAAPTPIGVLQMASLAQNAGPERADLIRVGDTLNIAIFEVGVSLFGSATAATADTTRTPSADARNLTVQVREDGTTDLPYVGAIRAAGAYPEELAGVIRQRMQRLSEHPQVTVSIADSVRSVVYVSGAVARAGRYRLTAAHERLLDALALAGGSPLDRNDLSVTLVRGNQQITVPVNRISPGDAANIIMLPGDRLEFDRARESYTVFGATGKVSQVTFDAKTVSLAEAIARVGGPSDAQANPRGVFLFRIEQEADGKPRAMVYQLNMLKPEAYFLAQRFPLRDKDAILFTNARANLAQKFVSLLSQLFSPAMAVRYATQ